MTEEIIKRDGVELYYLCFLHRYSCPVSGEKNSRLTDSLPASGKRWVKKLTYKLSSLSPVALFEQQLFKTTSSRLN